MTKCIVFTASDGALSVMHPVPNARLIMVNGEIAPAFMVGKYREIAAFKKDASSGTVEFAETEDEFVARLAAKDVPTDAVDPQIVAVSDLPTDRTFRSAWTATQGGVGIDMGKAKEVVRGALRRKREPLLAAADVEYLLADESNDTKAKKDIAARKKALRDVTADPRIEAAQSLNDLKPLLDLV